MPGQTLMRRARRSAFAKSARSVARPRRSTSVRALLVDRGLELARQLAPQAQQLARRAARASRGVSFESSKRLRDPAGRAPRPGSRRSARTRGAGPPASRRRSNGSTWSVKNRNGAVSPYSSPWKSSGVKGQKRTTAAATRRFSAGSRSPSARLPTWSWFCAQATIRGPSGRAARRRSRPASRRSPRSSRRARRSARRAARGGGRRATSRRGPTRWSGRKSGWPISLITSAPGSTARTRSASSASTCARRVVAGPRGRRRAAGRRSGSRAPRARRSGSPTRARPLRVVERVAPGRLAEAGR